MYRTITIHLPAEIAHTIEIRAAIDDLTLIAGIEQLLTEAVAQWRAKS